MVPRSVIRSAMERKFGNEKGNMLSPEQALQIIRRVVEGVNLTWADHQTIQQALGVLEQSTQARNIQGPTVVQGNAQHESVEYINPPG